ncbi:HEAT repeat domain-containing protein [Streptomyces sp. B1I3]|uniref:HEAT repeat domain-containing protein n=1 Tax=Streptomyces sp. B1I3 TaxID=3042264 RepID=UPI0027D8DAB8|nr:HEAT repeat domain-containing protein [Streptomyces sp. B1I3]
MSEGGLDEQLRAAVRAGDADAVRSLVGSGADPDTVGADGLPVLFGAVAAYDAAVAEALVEGGADPDRALPDGTTPLWRAVDGGSPAVVSAVLGKEPRLRLPEAAREQLLTVARSWYESGAAGELRRRTGAAGPAVTVRVHDDEYNHVDEVSLGGLVVRAGHGAVLTSLEWAFGILTPVDELIGRAVGRPDEDDVHWSAVRWVLTARRDAGTWSAVVVHRHHPAPAHRRFVADLLWSRGVSLGNDTCSEKRDSVFLIGWAAEERDSVMLAKVLHALTEYEDPGQEAVGLRYAAHADPRVRREVPWALTQEGVSRSPASCAALLTLLRDPDAEVRREACAAGARDDGMIAGITEALLMLAEEPDAASRTAAAAGLAASRDRTPAVADTLAALLGESDQLVRLEAAYGLARRDDPRTAEAIGRVGPLGPGFEHDHRAHALLEWRWRQREAR